MKDNTAALFNSKRRRKLAEVYAPDVLTERRAEPILTRNQAAIKAAVMREKLFAAQDIEDREKGEEKPQLGHMAWPENPREGQEMLKAILTALDMGTAHLSNVIDDEGNRRVIWRGCETPVILSADVCLKRYGVSGQPLILLPFDDSISVGRIEPPGVRS